MSNAKTAQVIDAALKEQAERTAAIINNAVHSIAQLVARDMVTICARLDALEKAVAPTAEPSAGSRDSPNRTSDQTAT